MCLAVPMLLLSVDGCRGVVAVDGVQREIRLDLIEAARPGDWVLVHAGFAIQTLDETAAAESLELLRELLGSDATPGPAEAEAADGPESGAGPAARGAFASPGAPGVPVPPRRSPE